MNIELISKLNIFRGMNEPEIYTALEKLHAKEKHYKKNEPILSAGEPTDKMGLVLKGSVTIENNDIWGNRTILSNIGEGQSFAETYAFLDKEPLMVDAIANENCSVLFLNLTGLRRSISVSDSWTLKLTTNLLMISTHKNLVLSNRSFHTAPKTIRGRVMAYLNSVMLKTSNREFDIPFDRQQLADYLNLERSALSKELGKMQKDGLILVKKNHFTIISPELS